MSDVNISSDPPSDVLAVPPERRPDVLPVSVEELAAQLCIVAAVNDDASLAHNLMRSDLITRYGVPVHVERGAPSASVAYNRGLDATQAPLILFVHQDVYMPPDFMEHLLHALGALDRGDPDWALVAPVGMERKDGRHRADVWSTGLGCRDGLPVDPDQPVPAQSFDELAFVMRRSAGLRFDEDLPLYHLYGTDIVQASWAAGRGAYIANLPIVHNDNFHGRLGSDFTAGYHYVRRKWRAALPLRTTVVKIRWHGLDLAIYRLRAARLLEKRRARAGDTGTDPRVFSAQCGWEPEGETPDQ